MRRGKKNPFMKEVERRFGENGFELNSFVCGKRKLKITKDEIEDSFLKISFAIINESE